MKNITLFIPIICLVFFTYGCAKKSGIRNAGNENQIKKVNVQTGNIRMTVSSTGRIVSNLDVEIKCKASGEVINIPFDISDVVKKGDLVAELDPTEEQRNVTKAKVSLFGAESRLAKTKQTLQIAETDLKNSRKKSEINFQVAKAKALDARAKADRVKKLYEQNLAGLEELETAETSAANAESAVETAQIALDELKSEEAGLELKRQDVELAKNDLESARINLELAEQRLDETKVYAPIDGIVTDRKIQTGQIISSGISNVGGGTTILTLSDLSRLFVLANIDESDIGTIREGQEVAVTADAYPDMSFKGVVDRIAQKGESVSNVVTFEVRIEITSDNKSVLKPEMTANVEVFIAAKDNVLLLPVNAVRTKGTQKTVSIEKPDGSSEVVIVETGINDGEMIEIISGLNEGDTIIFDTAGYESAWRKRMEEISRNRPPGGGPH